MIGSSEHTLTSEKVHALAIQVLLQLPFVTDKNKKKARNVLNVLLYAAAFRTSINQACQMLQDTQN